MTVVLLVRKTPQWLLQDKCEFANEGWPYSRVTTNDIFCEPRLGGLLKRYQREP
jgi:hypothetical protein